MEGGVDILKQRLLRAADEYGRPLCISETSAGRTADEKTVWMEKIRDLINGMRAQGTRIVGVNWWPLYDAIQWDCRGNTKTVVECIRKGGYNIGLYGIEERDDGTLARIPTAAVDGFLRILRPLAEG